MREPVSCPPQPFTWGSTLHQYQKAALWGHKLHPQGLPTLPLACMQTLVPGFLPTLQAKSRLYCEVTSGLQGPLPEHGCVLCDPLLWSANCSCISWISVNSSVALRPPQTPHPQCGCCLACLHGRWPRPATTLLPCFCLSRPPAQGVWKPGGCREEQRWGSNHPDTKMMPYHQIEISRIWQEKVLIQPHLGAISKPIFQPLFMFFGISDVITV